jgi:hypothetical protein
VISVTNVYGLEDTTFNLSCPSNKIVSVYNVFYGKREINFSNSVANDLINNHYNNKTICSITVGSNPGLDDLFFFMA